MKKIQRVRAPRLGIYSVVTIGAAASGIFACLSHELDDKQIHSTNQRLAHRMNAIRTADQLLCKKSEALYSSLNDVAKCRESCREYLENQRIAIQAMVDSRFSYLISQIDRIAATKTQVLEAELVAVDSEIERTRAEYDAARESGGSEFDTAAHVTPILPIMQSNGDETTELFPYPIEHGSFGVSNLSPSVAQLSRYLDGMGHVICCPSLSPDDVAAKVSNCQSHTGIELHAYNVTLCSLCRPYRCLSQLFLGH